MQAVCDSLCYIWTPNEAVFKYGKPFAFKPEHLLHDSMTVDKFGL